MKKIENTADRYIRLLRKRHKKITSSPEKSRLFLEKLGLYDEKNKIPVVSP